MNHEKAVALCIELEEIAPLYGLHIGLTGGCLYKNGERKDVDILLYRIRQRMTPDLEGFYGQLVLKGWTIGRRISWVQKFKTPQGDEVDLFYPELPITENEAKYVE